MRDLETVGGPDHKYIDTVNGNRTRLMRNRYDNQLTDFQVVKLLVFAMCYAVYVIGILPS